MTPEADRRLDQSAAPVRVLVATPLGQGGQGGIDRIMDGVRAELAARPRPAVEVAFATTRGKGSILVSPVVLAGFLTRMTAMRLQGRADVLHINLSSGGSTARKLIVAGAARRLGLPYVIHLHGSQFRQYWDGATPALGARIADLFRHARTVLVLGGVWRDYVAARVPDANIRILPNASPAPAAPTRVEAIEPAHILFLGRVGKRKGAYDLVEALAKLKTERPWRATIAGDGEVEAVQRLVAERGLADRVTLPGWVGPDQVTALLGEASALVLPSYDENLPMSVIEGMAHGLAVVATPVGAVEDIVRHGETGLLTPPGDPAALAERLSTLVDDAQLRSKLGAAAERFHRDHLEMKPYVDRLVEVWREAARPTGPGGA